METRLQINSKFYFAQREFSVIAILPFTENLSYFKVKDVLTEEILYLLL